MFWLLSISDMIQLTISNSTKLLCFNLNKKSRFNLIQITNLVHPPLQVFYMPLIIWINFFHPILLIIYNSISFSFPFRFDSHCKNLTYHSRLDSDFMIQFNSAFPIQFYSVFWFYSTSTAQIWCTIPDSTQLFQLNFTQHFWFFAQYLWFKFTQFSDLIQPPLHEFDSPFPIWLRFFIQFYSFFMIQFK